MLAESSVAGPVEFFSWAQLSILITIISAIAISTGFLTRNIDRKLNIVDYEKKHYDIQSMTNKHEIRLSLLEERYNRIIKILEKNGLNKDKH